MNNTIRRLSVFLFLIFIPGLLWSQDPVQTETTQSDEPALPAQVDVQPQAEDSEIRDRLTGILTSTGWFAESDVDVNDGVVFLRGRTESDEYKRWAGDLARNLQDVTAVINQIEVTEPDIWNYEPALTGMQEIWHNMLRAIPFLVFGITVLILFWGIAVLISKMMRAYLRRRKMNNLLQDIAARTIGVVVFLSGLYIVFHLAGLANVAMTVLGGTGLLGIVLGIAFRDITENFLASIFLSIQNPFRAGDLVQISEQTGFIERLTIRATLLMTLDGNHMQIPNSTVYKSSILNFTSNPNQRTTFTIGIGYDNSVTTAQEIGSNVLNNHPGVLKEPEFWILVDKLDSSTINLKFYFWVDGSRHNLLKVKSSLMRQVKSAYQKENISMPGEEREIIFPDGVPVHKQSGEKSQDVQPAGEISAADDSRLETDAEGRLQSNDDEIREQARRSRSPEEGENLLAKN